MKYLLLLLLLPLSVWAEPVAVASGNGITITIHTDPCKSEGVKNLPKRATWKEAGGEVEGCYGVAGGQIVMMYFDDKTVAVLPVQLFKRVNGV